jgi:hypothetical protein
MDHAPERLPARHVPLTVACTALAKMSANGASARILVLARHVPAYSDLPLAADARHAPFQPDGDFEADHTPRATVVPRASLSVHVPVTLPILATAVAIQVPPTVKPVMLVADHVFGGPFCARGAAVCALDVSTPARSKAQKSATLTVILERRYRCSLSSFAASIAASAGASMFGASCSLSQMYSINSAVGINSAV